MSKILIAGEENKENEENEEQELKINFEPTEEDEESFFLIYHLHMAPSEAAALNKDYRKWLIARFIMQKQAEREMVERHHLLQQIGPNMKV